MQLNADPGNKSQAVLKASRAKAASYRLLSLSAETRVKVLLAIAAALDQNREKIKKANAQDLEAGKTKGLAASLLDRLLLNDKRITEMIEGLKNVAAQEDRLGQIEQMTKRPNGMMNGLMVAPMGVIAIIYEARPNVTVDAAGICIKAGNAVVLRGGSEAMQSNLSLIKLMQDAAVKAGLPDGAIEFIDDPAHGLVDELVGLRQYIDVLIPRGGQTFIDHIVSIAKVPIIETGAGNCHTYVHEDADLEMALNLVLNGKVQRPSVCNATKKVLVHRAVAEKFLPQLKSKLTPCGVIFLTDDRAKPYFPEVKLASPAEWYEEFLDMRLGVKIVDSMADAISHINQYSSHHTEAICTRDYASAMQFITSVDSASVLWNASTRFTDGGQFGLGAEIGISTQKLHWRGPMGVAQLQTKKWVTFGTGQIRE